MRHTITARWATILGVIVLVLVGFLAATTRSADSTPPTYPYEQTVCWQMDAPDLTNPGSYEWPQTKVDCAVVPSASTSACGPAAKYQVDTYWIRDDGDRDHLAGMSSMSSPADDAALEPHGYYAVLVTAKPAEECAPPPTPTVPPTPTEPPVTEPPTPTEPPVVPPTNPPRDCRENPVTCPEAPKPPKHQPPTAPRTPTRQCIDENTIKVTHSDGTVDFVNDDGVCDDDDNPPAREEGL